MRRAGRRPILETKGRAVPKDPSLEDSMSLSTPRLLALIASIGAGVLALAPAAALGGPPRETGCQVASNVEAIIDDSPSMIDNDPNRQRKSLMELLIHKEEVNGEKTLGAVEFGASAGPLFGPLPIRGNRADMIRALDAGVQGDFSGTNYSAAFVAARAHNPAANARLFLSDGEHLTSHYGPYDDSHFVWPPTYTVGFGGAIQGQGPALLQRIASETGGSYFRVDAAEALLPRASEISNHLNCLPPPRTIVNTIGRQGQAIAHALTVRRGTSFFDFDVSWADATAAIDLTSLRIIRRGKVVRRSGAAGTAARRKSPRLRVTRRRGSRFVTVRVSRLVPGRLAFKLKASRLSAPMKVTTQVTAVGW